jgi:hypothetical protein
MLPDVMDRELWGGVDDIEAADSKLRTATPDHLLVIASIFSSRANLTGRA